MENKTQISKKSIEKELRRLKNIKRLKKLSKITLRVVVILLVVVILTSVLWLQVFKVHEDSMLPNLKENDYIVASKQKTYEVGDIIVFNKGDKTYIKRVIGTQGDSIDIDQWGNVYINNKQLQETYVNNYSLEPSNIEYPYTVETNSLFVLGDNRLMSIDSRNNEIGSINKDSVLGKVTFCVWPLSDFGKIK